MPRQITRTKGAATVVVVNPLPVTVSGGKAMQAVSCKHRVAFYAVASESLDEVACSRERTECVARAE